MLFVVNLAWRRLNYMNGENITINNNVKILCYFLISNKFAKNVPLKLFIKMSKFS